MVVIIKMEGPIGIDWRDNYTSDDEKKLDEVYTGENSLPTDTWETNQIAVGETSIGTYGGFYIGRYEAGIPEEASFNIKNIDSENNYVNTKGENFTVYGAVTDTISYARGSIADTGSIKDLKPVSRQGMQAWNYITQPNAKMVAENMYKDGKNAAGSKVGVKSYLLDSQVWNHICKNIYKAVSGQSNNDSAEWGNYYNNTTTNYESLNCLWAKHDGYGLKSWTVTTKYNFGGITKDDYPKGSGTAGIELATGASDDFKRYNIYDMAGNVFEWTTDHNILNDQFFVTCRGGSFTDGGTSSTVVVASGSDNFTRYGFHIGFRVVLYINPTN